MKSATEEEGLVGVPIRKMKEKLQQEKPELFADLKCGI